MAKSSPLPTLITNTQSNPQPGAILFGWRQEKAILTIQAYLLNHNIVNIVGWGSTDTVATVLNLGDNHLRASTQCSLNLALLNVKLHEEAGGSQDRDGASQKP